MKFVYYEDEWCYYIWKPAGIPSTFGKEKSFLELIIEERGNIVIDSLLKEFSKEEEYGLLNRLDNATTGLLYFAKNRNIKERYKEKQKEGNIKKFYVLDVYGDIRYWIKDNGNEILYPIAHHKYSKDRMVVIKGNNEEGKIESRLHRVKTKILESCYNEVEQTTTLIVMIQKGIRHQIRSHFSAIGYPIVGDDMYGKKKDLQKGNLHLYSIGLSVL